MTADPFDALVAPLIRVEGAYANKPSDPGGKTMWGITEPVARAYGYRGPMAGLSQDTAKQIYRWRYWTQPGFDAVAGYSVPIAAELFDCGVNMGVTEAGTFLQRTLNVFNHQGKDYPDLDLDGKVGPVTVGALEALLRIRGPSGERVVLRSMVCLRGARYVELTEANPNLEAFAFGWLANRVGIPA
jgi:lysozyme family protein